MNKFVDTIKVVGVLFVLFGAILANGLHYIGVGGNLKFTLLALGVLGVCVAIDFLGLWKSLNRLRKMKEFKKSLALCIGVVVLSIVWVSARGRFEVPSVRDILDLGFFFFYWVVLLVAAIYFSRIVQEREFYQEDRYPFSRFLWATSAAMIVVLFCAWFGQPLLARQFHIDLGGNYIYFSAIVSSLGFYFIGATNMTFGKMAMGLSLYSLALLSTSRLLMILIPLYLILILIKHINMGAFKKAVLAGFIVVTWPFVFYGATYQFMGKYFPTRIEVPAEEMEQVLQSRKVDMVSRLLRNLRLVHKIAGGYGDSFLGLDDMSKFQSDIIKGGEARVEIFKKTGEQIYENPGGIWPRNFQDVLQILCGEDYFCSYPHNVFLEIALKWGVVATVGFAFQVLVLLIAGLRFFVNDKRDGFLSFSYIMFIGLFCFSLVSGTFYDWIQAYLILLIPILFQVPKFDNLKEQKEGVCG